MLNSSAFTAFDFFAGGGASLGLRKLPALRRAAMNRYEQGALFRKEVATL